MSMEACPLIGVIDVETTGLFPHRFDRIIEIAAVVVSTDGRIEREFVSMVNPERDVGPTSIHGLTATDVLHAPRFADVVPMVMAALEGVVAIAAHNLRFDQQFMTHECARAGVTWPACFGLCTLQLAGGGKLSKCCADLGVEVQGEGHSALVDARAAAGLLSRLLADSPSWIAELCGRPLIQWPQVRSSSKQPVTREASRALRQQESGYIPRLLTRLSAEPLPELFDDAVLAYSALLDRVLEDRRLDEGEGEALLDLAQMWGLGREQVEQTHSAYVHRLAVAAVSDGVVTDNERRDLHAVCSLLGLSDDSLDQLLDEAVKRLTSAPASASVSYPAATPSFGAGQRVCFTGEAACRYRGEPITRVLAAKLVSDAGLQMVDGVTKALDALVVADPHTQSGKAKKARQYGIRIVHEPVFWAAVGVAVE